MAVTQYQPMGRRSDTTRSSTQAAPETRLLADLARLEWLHSPSPIERLEAAVGRKRLSQLLLLVALCPDEDDLLAGAFAGTQAA